MLFAENIGEPVNVEHLKRAFAEAALPLPPIPAQFHGRLHTISKWGFSTRPVSAMEMYFFRDYIAEALQGISEYWAVSHAGHGINSYAVTLQLVEHPLVLMVQTGFAGAYSSNPQDLASLTDQFSRCSALVRALPVVRQRLPSSARLCIFESNIRSDAWGVLDQPVNDCAEADEWLRARETSAYGHSVWDRRPPKALRWLQR